MIQGNSCIMDKIIKFLCSLERNVHALFKSSLLLFLAQPKVELYHKNRRPIFVIELVLFNNIHKLVTKCGVSIIQQRDTLILPFWPRIKGHDGNNWSRVGAGDND